MRSHLLVRALLVLLAGLTWPVVDGTAPLQAIPPAHISPITVITYSRDGKLLATGARDHSISIWDPLTGQLTRAIEAHDGAVTALSFSHDNELLASGSFDKKVKIWNVATGALVNTIEQADRITGLAFAPRGHLLAVASWDNMVRIYDVPAVREKTTEPIWSWPETATAPEVVAFSPDGKLLATGSWDRVMRLWDLRRFKLLRILHGHNSGVTKLAFTADSETLASGSGDGDVKLWKVADGTQLRTMRRSPAYVTSVAIAPGGETVGSTQDRDTMLATWDARAGVLPQTLPASGPAVFTPDGATLASANSWRVILWNVQNWTARLTLPLPKRVQE